MTDNEWTLIDKQGEEALTFAAFLDLDSSKNGQVSEYPIEEGSFASYNKTQSPCEMRVTLGMEGDPADLDHALHRLDEYQRKASLLIVSTPASLHENMTLVSYSYKRTKENNAGMLVVELSLKEIREVQTQVMTTVITEPKNPTSASSKKTGQTQGRERK